MVNNTVNNNINNKAKTKAKTISQKKELTTTTTTTFTILKHSIYRELLEYLVRLDLHDGHPLLLLHLGVEGLCRLRGRVVGRAVTG